MNLPLVIPRIASLKRFIPTAQTINGALADALALTGALLVVAGIHQIYGPAAFIFGGLFLLVFSLAMTRRAS